MGFFDKIQGAVFGNSLVAGQVEKALKVKAAEAKLQRKLLRAGPIDDSRAQHVPLFRYDEPSGHGPRKMLGVSYEVLRAFTRNNPWLRAVIDIRKREIASADWDIVPDIERHKKELDNLKHLVLSAYRFEDRGRLLGKFKPQYLDPKMVVDIVAATYKKGADELAPSDVAFRFMLALQDLQRTAEEHAAPVRKLFENPNRNQKPWAHILRAVVPDILTLDQGCIETRRLMYPETEPGSGSARSTNPITELHWIDGATIRPCIDRHGQFRGIAEGKENEFAFEQWLDGKKTDAGGFRLCDMLYIQENPQTDVRMKGYGFSRVESLIMTSTLEAMADKSDLEEFKRAFYGGFLNIQDESFMPEDVAGLRSFIEEELEGTNKIPITAFDKLEYVATHSSDSGRDKKSIEKLKRYVLRICAMFEMPPIKIAIYESANYNTSETSQDIADDGLRNLLHLVDESVSRGIVADFGHADIKYQSLPDHNRDDPEKLGVLKTRQELGIDTPNDTRAEYGKEPTEWGEQPAPYFSKYFEFKGQADGSEGEEGEGEEGEGEEGEEGAGEEFDDDEEQFQDDEGDEKGEDKGKDKQSPFKGKGKGKPGDDKEQDDEGDEDSGDEVEKALVSGFAKAVRQYKESHDGRTPEIEFDVTE